MICKNCGRELQDSSIFCNWCGKKQIRERHKVKTITVPEPRQLPSGMWNIQLRREGESITESTAERCRRAALEVRKQWLAEEQLGMHGRSPEYLTLGNAIDRYIADNSNILSPSTLRSYYSMREHRFQGCMDWNIFAEDNNWQAAVNDEYTDKLSAKTVMNAWRLCTAAMNHAGIEVPRVNLRRPVPKEHRYLTYEQIPTFLEAIKGDECELPVLLALHSLRLSEVLALRPSDISIKTKTLHIRGARVLNKDNDLVHRENNKTEKSRRDVPIMIPRLLVLLKHVDSSQEFIVPANRKRLYDKINRLCKAHDLPGIGVHGLRHSFASLAYHLGWKEKSTMQVGGWTNSAIVHEIYTHNADLESDINTMKEFYK